MKRFTVTASPIFGHNRSKAYGIRIGDVVEAADTLTTDSDGDYLVSVQRTGSYAYVKPECLTPLEPGGPKVAVAAVRKALTTLGISKADAEKTLALAQAIEEGI